MLGLNAYWWEGTASNPNKISMGKGVRFDKFGIYGYDTSLEGASGALVFDPHKQNPNPSQELTSEVLMNMPDISFALTW
jgi:hypothetical protein